MAGVAVWLTCAVPVADDTLDHACVAARALDERVELVVRLHRTLEAGRDVLADLI